MNSDLYEEVRALAEDYVEASSQANTKMQWDIYNSLLLLCEENKITEKNHPLQWEALADFTSDDSKAIEIYEKALNPAKQLGLDEYIASIYLAMAERYLATGKHGKASECATLADNAAKQTANLELRKEISEFLLNELANT